MRVTRYATSFAVALCVTVLAPLSVSPAGATTPPTWLLASTPDTSATLSNVLYADSCVSGGACMAVGSSTTAAGHAQTLVESWNGTSWAMVPSPNTSPTLDNVLYAVSCTSTSACVAVGTSTSALGQTQTLAELWNGSKWSISTTPNTSNGFDNTLSGVSCTSAATCTAVGYAATATGSVTLVETWNASTWSIATSPNEPGTLYDSLNGISCPSSLSCVAVGNYLTAADSLQTLVESWNGSIWSVVASPDTTTAKSNTLNGVSCATATACTAVGAAYASGGSAYQTLAESWNGASWSIVSTPDVTSSDNVLEAVSCPSASWCAASGYSTTGSDIQQGLIETWNGVTWSAATTPEPGSFGNSVPAVGCPQASACVAVGSEEPSPGVLQTVAESTFVAPTLTAPPTATFNFGALDSFAVTGTGAPAPTYTETGAPVGCDHQPGDRRGVGGHQETRHLPGDHHGFQRRVGACHEGRAADGGGLRHHHHVTPAGHPRGSLFGPVIGHRCRRAVGVEEGRQVPEGPQGGCDRGDRRNGISQDRRRLLHGQGDGYRIHHGRELEGGRHPGAGRSVGERRPGAGDHARGRQSVSRSVYSLPRAAPDGRRAHTMASDTAPDTASDTPRLIDHVRGVRYGEVIAVFHRDGRFEAEVFGTQFLNECPQELWDGLDPTALAEELGAVMVKLNGPRHWVLDGMGTKVNAMEPVLRDFNGLLMRRLAVIDLGDNPGTSPYAEVKVDRGAVFFFDAGKPVYELVDPDGLAYVMQALCIGVDPDTTEASLVTLGERLDMPEGWSYRTRILDRELVVDTTATIATVIQDEFENSYTLPGVTSPPR